MQTLLYLNERCPFHGHIARFLLERRGTPDEFPALSRIWQVMRPVAMAW